MGDCRPGVIAHPQIKRHVKKRLPLGFGLGGRLRRGEIPVFSWLRVKKKLDDSSTRH